MSCSLFAGKAPLRFEVKSAPAHFRVIEERATPPSASGEHLHLWVEKEALTTERAVRILSRALGRPTSVFGFCGLKDREAITRQWISVQGGDPARLSELHSTHLRVLEFAFDRAKLRRGGHAGNRFEILLEGFDAGEEGELAGRLAVLQARGLPNFFGPQRYGNAGINVTLGRALCLGTVRDYLGAYLCAAHLGPYEHESDLLAVLDSQDKAVWRHAATLAHKVPREASFLAKQMERRPLDPASLLRTIPKNERRLHAHSLQSALFDLWLALRMEDPEWPRPLVGDCLGVPGVRDTHWATDREPLAPGGPRILGPLFGGSMSVSRSAALEVEQRTLELAGFRPADFGRGTHPDLAGARRPMVVPIDKLAIQRGQEGLWMHFSLPPGSYATALLAQLRQDFPVSPLLAPR